MSTDAELLLRYVRDRSEPAFAELVQRHLNLVYFAALRQVGGDAHRAQDVAQSVFTDLARKAASLADRATLTGWLHTSTRFAAAKARRADFTRQLREQEATTMHALLSDPDPAADWERLRPLIDDAIHELDERDREAVLLRYFENRPFAEIGATLRLSEDAARMRVDRALEKLRAALARRGVNSTSAALALAFANQVAATAPAGLAGTITSAALAGAATGGAVATSAGIFMSNLSTIAASTVAVIAIGATFLQWNRAQRAEVELAALNADRDGLRSQLAAEQERAKQSTQEMAALRGEVDALKAKQAAMAAMQHALSAPVNAPQVGAQPSTLGLRQRAVLNNLRQLAAARDQFMLENGRWPASIEELVGETKYVKRINAVDGENYAGISLVRGQTMVVTMADGNAVSYDGGGPNTTRPEMSPAEMRVRDLAEKVKPALGKALEAYRAANAGKSPANPEALLPYFATPQEGADFVEALEAQKELARGK